MGEEDSLVAHAGMSDLASAVGGIEGLELSMVRGDESIGLCRVNERHDQMHSRHRIAEVECGEMLRLRRDEQDCSAVNNRWDNVVWNLRMSV
jgi:hypothetical protein